jgi:NADPH:quinone reductase-like Zn-dependent oxidoreductase
MKAFVSRSYKGIESLAIEEIPAPAAPGPGQVRIAMRAATLNYRDLLSISGSLGRSPLGYLIPISDGAGEVIEAGADVWRVKVGDRVALTFNPDWIGGEWRLSPGAMGRGGRSLPGVMREQIVVNQAEVVVLPSHLSFEEGASLPCAAVTAWCALCGEAPLMPGMTVLTQGGGGVSLFALQFAKLFGARVIVISSSPERCARIKSLGADEAIDYSAEPEWDKAVRGLTGGMGVDLTVEVGGAKTVDRALAATRIGGRLALVGLLTGIPNIASSMYSAGVEISPMKVGSREHLEAITRAMAFHKLRPVVDSRYSFEQLPEALRHLQSGRHLGKIAISFSLS